jgi:lipopolysaccharide/colanic/teichoic acid biosynthesis glycosyltransferase
VTSALSPDPDARSLAASDAASLPLDGPVVEAGSAPAVSDEARAALVVVPSSPSGDVVIDISDAAHPAIVDLIDATTWVPDDVRGTGLLVAATWQRFVKRALDVLGSVAMLTVLSPLLLVTAVAVGLTSPGGVFYRQERVGRDGRHFRMIKFRSMVRDAHAMRSLLEDQNRHAPGPIFKIPDDPRVTRVGRVIRRFSIDELPQLMNVIMGDMSLVGPRPPLPEEFDRYDQREMQRVLVRPGLTCIWQVSGRSEVDFDQWIDMDLEYIRTWTLTLDVRLLLKSIPAVIAGHGAY